MKLGKFSHFLKKKKLSYVIILSYYSLYFSGTYSGAIHIKRGLCTMVWLDRSSKIGRFWKNRVWSRGCKIGGVRYDKTSSNVQWMHFEANIIKSVSKEKLAVLHFHEIFQKRIIFKISCRNIFFLPLDTVPPCNTSTILWEEKNEWEWDLRVDCRYLLDK